MSETPRELIRQSIIHAHGALMADDVLHKLAAGIAADDVLHKLAAEGWVIVPKVPSDAMINAGLIPTAAWLDIPGSKLTVNRIKMRRRYEAMILAATS